MARTAASRLFWSTLVLILTVVGRTGAAEDENHPPGWYCPVGVNVGLSADDEGLGLLLGGEASAAYLEGTWWYGLFVDGLVDLHRDTTRIGVGPELGWFVLGLDIAAVLELSGGEAIWGTRVRGLLSLSLVSFYSGWVHQFGVGGGDFGEVGALLKWPFEL